MGESKRRDTISQNAVNEAVVRPAPISLSEWEIGEHPVVGEPVAVRAWVRFPEAPIRVEALAVAWTRRAVKVEFQLRDGRTLSTWVWASAVDRS